MGRSNTRPKGPLGRKRDEEAIWGDLLKTRTNRTSCRQVPCRGKTPMFTKAESAQPYKYRLFAVTGNCWSHDTSLCRQKRRKKIASSWQATRPARLTGNYCRISLSRRRHSRSSDQKSTGVLIVVYEDGPQNTPFSRRFRPAGNC